MLYKVPKLYDYIVDQLLNFESDPVLADMLDRALQLDKLPPNARVLDLACGTGIITFRIAQERPDVQVIGIDIAKQMIADAEQKAAELKLKNVRFITKSARDLALAELAQDAQAAAQPVDMIVCAHGYTAMPEGEQIFEKTLGLLREGGRYVIVDVYSPCDTILLRLNNYLDRWFLNADSSRQPWLLLQRRLASYQREENRIPGFRSWAYVYYVAHGVKHVAGQVG